MVVDLIRRGYRVEYVPEAKSFEYVSASARDEMKRRRRMTAGGFQFMAMSGKILPKGNFLEVWKIVSHKYLRNLPEAKSFEYVSASARDEMKRRRRMTAGGFQFMAMSGKILPKGNFLEVWKIVSHKYLRNLMPIFMILALLANILGVIFSSNTGGFFGLQYPNNWVLLILQLGFYGLALLGNLFPKKSQSKLSKLLYLPTFFVNSNLAMLSGLFLFLQDKESHLWERVQRVEE